MARGEVRGRIVRDEDLASDGGDLDVLREVEASCVRRLHERRAEGGVAKHDHAVWRQW